MAQNLAAKYRPSSFDEVVGQDVVVDIVKNICESGEISNRNFLFVGSAGCGKAQPLSSLVLTPSGYIEMGSITAGTKVFTRYGDIAEVTDIFPQGQRDIYTITLDDGSKFDVADNHLNVVYQVVHGQKREYVLDTLELIDRCNAANSQNKFYIDNVTIPKYTDAPSFKMDPYLGGFLCSSSSMTSKSAITLTVRRKDVDISEAFYLLSSDYNITPLLTSDTTYEIKLDAQKGSDLTYHKNSTLFLDHLSEYMVFGKNTNAKRFKPDIQLADIEIRLEFIRGFLDGLLAANHYDSKSITCTSIISAVFRSSGYIDRVRKYGTSVANTTWVHDFRKCDELKHRREIVSISYKGSEECQCIYVDNPDHTYVTDYMIPTHNTTLARIIANELNEGKGEPIEIDAASHGSVESVRQLVDQARTYPVGCNWKIFIIDECHAVSTSGWQAFLKAIEEQPARAIFMFCTTNPEKIPATVLSRVQTFQLSKISLDGIYNRLKYIVEQENKEGRGIVADDDAIKFISRLAQGGLRDSITLLDKALAYSNEITLDTISKSLGLPNYDKYFELLNAVAKKDNQAIVTIINDVYNSGLNFVKWFEGFFGFITNIVKYIYLKDINQTMIPSTYQDKIQAYGPAHSAICLKLSNTLVKMNQELKTSQYLQEIAISYLCTPPQLKK